MQKHWCIQKHWRWEKTWRMVKTWHFKNIRQIVKTWRIQNLRRMVKTWHIQNLRRMVKTWCLEKYWRLQKCWRSRKRSWTRWRIAWLFRLGRICNCWLLSDPADEHVLLLADVESRTCSLQVKTELPAPCFYGRTLSRTVPAACTGPPCFKMVKSLTQAKYLASAWNFTVFS